MIHEVVRKIRTVDAQDGFIRIRKSAFEAGNEWGIELFGQACSLISLQVSE